MSWLCCVRLGIPARIGHRRVRPEAKLCGGDDALVRRQIFLRAGQRIERTETNQGFSRLFNATDLRGFLGLGDDSIGRKRCGRVELPVGWRESAG
jgi:hypothetical protein